MIPREAQRGSSFLGWYLYHLRDKNAITQNRVGWTHTRNMLTDDPEKAIKVMAYTAISAHRLKEAAGKAKTGRKLRLPVLSYSLSWPPQESPDKDEMLLAVKRSVQALGMEEYEALIVEHTDTEHAHVHVVINRAHPITGLAADNGQTKRKLSDFALKWEIEKGIIQCPQRKENYEMRQEGKHTQYNDPIIRAAWEQSSNGREFISLLEKHEYYLAQGHKRLVIVDAHGKIHAPTRHLSEINGEAFERKLDDLDFSILHDADRLSGAIQEYRKGNYYSRKPKQKAGGDSIRTIQDKEKVSTGSSKEIASNELPYSQEQEALSVSLIFKQVINRKRIELQKSHKLLEQRATIIAQEAKIENPRFLQKIFGLHSYRKYKLRSLKRRFTASCSSIEHELDLYEEEKNQSLDQLKNFHEQKRTDRRNGQ